MKHHAWFLLLALATACRDHGATASAAEIEGGPGAALTAPATPATPATPPAAPPTAAPPTAAPPPPPATPTTLEPRLAAMAELSFAPPDAVAVVRVDLAAVAAASADPAKTQKTFDFLLRAQQPTAWQVLSASRITVGRELSTLYLIVTPPLPSTEGAGGDPEPGLVAGAGAFDAVRLGAELRRAGATVESSGPGTAIYLWRGPAANAVGSTSPREGPPALGLAAVGVAPGLLLFGPPPLVRAAIARSTATTGLGDGRDVRHGPLATELLAVDRGAAVWAAALKLVEVPGLEHGHLVIKGTAVDLRAAFATAEQAEAFAKKLRGLLDAVALMGGATPVGSALATLKKNAKISVEGTTLTVVSTL